MSSGEFQPRVGVIMGSDSDMTTMTAVGEALRDSGLEPKVDYEFRVVSAHRTPEFMTEYAQGAAARGLEVIIPGAGGSAHLQGMTASETILPVAGVAVTSNPKVLNRALGSCIGMPEGKPLATFQARAGAYNAGLFAARILETSVDRSRVGIVTLHEDEAETMQHAGRSLGRLGLQEEVDYQFVSAPDYDTVNPEIEAWAEDHGFGILIAASSYRHTVPNALATNTKLPVLGVAITRNPDHMSEALDFIVNGDGGPVAAFQGPAGAFNAGLKAARILALNNPDLAPKLYEYDESLRVVNAAKDKIMHRLGDVEYAALGKEELEELINAEMTAIKAEAN